MVMGALHARFLIQVSFLYKLCEHSVGRSIFGRLCLVDFS